MKRKKTLVLLTIGIVLMVFSALCSIAYGNRKIPLGNVLQVILGQNVDAFETAVVQARMPRTVFGLLAGAALGVSGTLMQSITRNPIADPSILGVNTGASLFVVIGLAFFGVNGGSITIWLSFIGAAVTAALVYGIASAGGGNSPMKLALAGAAVSTALSSLVNTIMLPDSQVMKAFRFWQVGSISGASWSEILLMTPYLLVGFGLAFWMSSALDTLSLGDEMASGLGVSVTRTRAISALAGVLLCASVTALAGPIGFVGLMVPHLIRMFIGNNVKDLLFLSMIYGAVLLVFADVMGRVLGSPSELEVGIITAILGAPIFIYVVRKAKISDL